ncbi:PREDICTED: heavy metal-associated isoprenylated plant protein 22-like isoform X2 [Prunus mume]|uniref:Heavy metal-associated isoprenylated plant protein 22-like isoform X2 n=1 Tax=Prunus mume TaxID=102107 RepID=A0ABM0NSB0_PRUMU|nr:PREDICTED: heavy metal-associated isoprenylated plant protein 22-like isoform X2 [Prunus mume]
MTTVEMRVHMDCPGCESKVRNALQKLKGVDNVDIDMAMQKVTITGWADQKKVLKTVRKTGRRAELWQFPYSADHNNFSTDQYYNQQCNGPLNDYAPQPSSWYNYYKHGYDGPSHGYSQNPANSTSAYGYQTTAAFSDENPHACSII